MASPAPSTLTTFSEMPELPMAPEPLPSAVDERDRRLVSKEQTPTSLVIKLRLPMHKLHNIHNPSPSATASVHSSPPPSSPLLGPTTDAAKPIKKKSKAKKPKPAITTDGKPSDSTIQPLAGPRLGPKSNTGAINENLRALDRSGKPCRRWIRKPVVVHSLYGGTWKSPGWIGQGVKPTIA